MYQWQNKPTKRCWRHRFRSQWDDQWDSMLLKSPYLSICHIFIPYDTYSCFSYYQVTTVVPKLCIQPASRAGLYSAPVPGGGEAFHIQQP